MRARPTYPSLLEVNTRVWLTALSRRVGRVASLDDVPDAALDILADQGMDWVWLLGVWETSQASRHMVMEQLHAPSSLPPGTAARTQAQAPAASRSEFRELLPDLRDQDIGGSCFAITGYTIPAALGGSAALARFRQRLHQRGILLMLDFIPNHVALDHSWAFEHPEYFVPGTEASLAHGPDAYCRFLSRSGETILAYGRDPNFPPWSDTLQLNYAEPAVLEAMHGELARVADMCDGVRCDMAMLILPEVFGRQWGVQSIPFWAEAIARVRRRHADFVFLAEVYWNLEHRLQQEGFDYTYDKCLYDRLRWHDAESVRAHLGASLDFQCRLVRFLENHDESRAAAVFSPPQHQAAAVVTYLSPGLRFFHQGQFEGRVKRVPVQLVRAPEEPVDPGLKAFYDRLLALVRIPALRRGRWQMLECTPASHGDFTSKNLLVWQWETEDGDRWLVLVNYAPQTSQGFVRIPWPTPPVGTVSLHDALTSTRLEVDAADLALRGLYLDIPPWGARVLGPW